MKKFFAILFAVMFTLSLAACGSSAAQDAKSADKVFNVGICQLVQHPALDAATEGFKAALVEKLGDKVVFSEQNASGDPATCSVICNQFVSDGVDLIMANATPALQAAASATNEIPILGTSVTDYGTALGISDWTGCSGSNISGTSDLAPLEGQADMLLELFPDTKTVGIVFCSGEPNSRFQADIVKGLLEAKGLNVLEFTFADSNDVASVTANACDECEVLYIPTDNTAASCAEAINNVALNAAVPIICGEENLCAGCGVAALSISYFDLGFATGEMAAEILLEGADISAMEVRFAPNFTKKFNSAICDALGVSIPADYIAIEG